MTRTPRLIALALMATITTLATVVIVGPGANPAAANTVAIDIDCVVTTPRSGAVSEFSGLPLGPDVRKVGCRATTTPPISTAVEWRFDDAVEINPSENPVRGYCKAGRSWEAEVRVYGPDGQLLGEHAEPQTCPSDAPREFNAGLCDPPLATLVRGNDNTAHVGWSYPTDATTCDDDVDYFRIRVASGFSSVDYVVPATARTAQLQTHPDTPANAPVRATVYAGSINGESFFAGVSPPRIIGEYQARYTFVASNSPFGSFVTPHIDGWIAVRDTNGDGEIGDHTVPQTGLYPTGRELAPGANAVVGLRVDGGDHVVAHVRIGDNPADSEIVLLATRIHGGDRTASSFSDPSRLSFTVSTDNVASLALDRVFGSPPKVSAELSVALVDE